MTASSSECADLVIAIGTAISNWLPINVIRDANALVIFAPSALDAHSFTLQVTYDKAPDVTTPTHILDWNDGVGNIPAPGVNQAIIYPLPNGFNGIAIKDNTGNVAASRTFKVRKIWEGIGA